MMLGKITLFPGTFSALFIGIVILFPLPAIAASCPCCGQVYGDAAPGDEARVNALRAAHEASCCVSSGGRSGGSSGSYQQPGIDWGEIQRRQEAERKRLEQERQKKAAEEEAAKREEEAKGNFEKSKQKSMDLMKGAGSGILTAKTGLPQEIEDPSVAAALAALKRAQEVKTKIERGY